MNEPADDQVQGGPRAKLLSGALSARRFYLLKGAGLLTAGAVLAVLPLFESVDHFVFGLFEALAAFLFVVGVVYIRRARMSHPASVVYTNVNNAPPDLQLAWLRRWLPLGTLGFIVVSGLTAYDLARLESEEVSSVSVYWPVDRIYQAFGFWPAVMALPIIGICTLGVLLLMWRNAKKRLPSDGG